MRCFGRSLAAESQGWEKRRALRMIRLPGTRPMMKCDDPPRKLILEFIYGTRVSHARARPSASAWAFARLGMGVCNSVQSTTQVGNSYILHLKEHTYQQRIRRAPP